MKKNLLRGILVVTMVLLWTTAAFSTEKVIKWKVQGFVPAGMLYHDTLVRLADAVKKATNGRLIFEVYPAGSLVPPFEGVKAVSDGVYQANYGYALPSGSEKSLFPPSSAPFPVVSTLWICRCGSMKAAAKNYGRRCMTITDTR